MDIIKISYGYIYLDILPLDRGKGGGYIDRVVQFGGQKKVGVVFFGGWKRGRHGGQRQKVFQVGYSVVCFH